MIDFLTMDLQLFAEGGDSAGTPGETGADAAPQDGASSNPDNENQGNEQQPTSAAQLTPEEKQAKFNELIKGEYKEFYEKSIGGIIKQRLKGTQDKVDRLDALNPTLAMLADKYGVDANSKDFAQLLNKAIEEDNSFYEKEAMERGIDVSEVKRIHKLERDNRVLREQMQAIENQKQADALYMKWLQESDDVKQVYPDFDLQEETQNKEFLNMLKAGVSVRAAFEVIHRDEIIPAAMNFAAKKAETKVANSVIANQNRPKENGVSPSAATVFKRDVNSLTAKDRAEIVRRVQRGEKISF